VKCIDDEIPFEIPQGWAWCRLKDIGLTETGTTPPKEHPEYFGDYIDFVSPGNIINNQIGTVNQGLSVLGVKYGRVISPQSVIQVCIGGSIGKCAIAYKSITFNQQINSVTPIFCDTEYTFIVLQSDYIRQSITSRATGTATPIINKSNWELLLLPLPPLQEQIAISNKYRILSPHIHKYLVEANGLQKYNTIIFENLKKSILQEAIQGKLVPQIESEGTAQELLEQIQQEKLRLVKEGVLKKSTLASSVIFKGDDNKYYEKNGDELNCIDDETPFEIPATWRWVRLNDICSYIQRGKSPKYSPIKKYPVVAQKCNQWSGFSIEKAQFIEPDSLHTYGEERLLQDNDLLWNSTGLGTLGRIAIYKTELNPYELAVADSHVTVIRPLKGFVLSEYLYAYFASYTVQSVIEEKSDGSTKQKELAIATVKSYLIPLPPTYEQLRIVSKIKELTSIMRK
jgi:type I restriction enzyme S subunit